MGIYLLIGNFKKENEGERSDDQGISVTLSGESEQNIHQKKNQGTAGLYKLIQIFKIDAIYVLKH